MVTVTGRRSFEVETPLKKQKLASHPPIHFGPPLGLAVAEIELLCASGDIPVFLGGFLRSHHPIHETAERCRLVSRLRFSENRNPQSRMSKNGQGWQLLDHTRRRESLQGYNVNTYIGMRAAEDLYLVDEIGAKANSTGRHPRRIIHFEKGIGSLNKHLRLMNR